MLLFTHFCNFLFGVKKETTYQHSTSNNLMMRPRALNTHSAFDMSVDERGGPVLASWCGAAAKCMHRCAKVPQPVVEGAAAGGVDRAALRCG